MFKGTMIHSDQWGGYMHGAIAAIPVIPPYPLNRGSYEPCGKLLEKYQNEIQICLVQIENFGVP